MKLHTPTPYDLTHLAMVGRDGLPVFLIPSATPDQALNERRKKERADILRAVNSHEALLKFSKTAKIMIDELLKTAKGPGADNWKWLEEQADKAIAQAEGQS